MVEGIGAGGGGGSANGNNAGVPAGGGGAGGYFRRIITSPNANYSYRCGTLGTGGGVAGVAGGNGNATVFDIGGTHNLSAPGGNGGSGANLTNNSTVKYTVGGAGGAVATGNGTVSNDLFAGGDPGQMGWSMSRVQTNGGPGGSTLYGGGGAPGNGNAANSAGAGGAGAGYGAGGGGAGVSRNGASVANAVGGNGTNGVIIITEYAS
jgi:hypothetical protein